MEDIFRVVPKKSVFRETTLSPDDFGESAVMEFPDRDSAEQWADEQNRSLSGNGRLTVHKAHPKDSSDADAYLVFMLQGVWTTE